MKSMSTIKQEISKSTFPCSWCGDMIEKGSTYFAFSNYVEDRGFCGRNRHHPECQRALERYMAERWVLRNHFRGTSDKRDEFNGEV